MATNSNILQAWLNFHDRAETELNRRFTGYSIWFGIAGKGFCARIMEGDVYRNEVFIERFAWRTPEGLIDYEGHGDDIIDRMESLLKVLLGSESEKYGDT